MDRFRLLRNDAPLIGRIPPSQLRRWLVRMFQDILSGRRGWAEPPAHPHIACWLHAKGTLRNDVFLPSKHLLCAFYETLPSKNPPKNLVFTDNPYRRLLRTLLRSAHC